MSHPPSPPQPSASTSARQDFVRSLGPGATLGEAFPNLFQAESPASLASSALGPSAPRSSDTPLLPPVSRTPSSASTVSRASHHTTPPTTPHPAALPPR